MGAAERAREREREGERGRKEGRNEKKKDDKGAGKLIVLERRDIDMESQEEMAKRGGRGVNIYMKSHGIYV